GEAWAARGGPGEDEGTAEVQRILRALAGRVALPHGVAVRVREGIPRHRGLGSGTQRDLALGVAVTRLAGHAVSAGELGRLLGRGRRSGIGIAAFARGGVVVDAGRRRSPDDGGSSEAAGELPPVVFRGRVPRDWVFVVATPGGIE